MKEVTSVPSGMVRRRLVRTWRAATLARLQYLHYEGMIVRGWGYRETHKAWLHWRGERLRQEHTATCYEASSKAWRELILSQAMRLFQVNTGRERSRLAVGARIKRHRARLFMLQWRASAETLTWEEGGCQRARFHGNRERRRQALQHWGVVLRWEAEHKDAMDDAITYSSSQKRALAWESWELQCSESCCARRATAELLWESLGLIVKMMRTDARSRCFVVAPNVSRYTTPI